jgi:DNA polymerase III epsilon subunit-like protein
MNSLSDNLIHVIDFEGTLITGVVEYGIVTLCGTEIVTTHTRLCKPRQWIPIEDTLIHKIQNAQAQKYASLEDDWDFFNQLRQSGPLCAHHACIEDRFLKNTWAMPQLAPGFDGSMISSWSPWIDTCALYRRLYKNVPSYALTSLIATFGLEATLTKLAHEYCPPSRRHAHAALYDAIAAALLLTRLATVLETGMPSREWFLTEGAQTQKARIARKQMELF